MWRALRFVFRGLREGARGRHSVARIEACHDAPRDWAPSVAFRALPG